MRSPVTAARWSDDGAPQGRQRFPVAEIPSLLLKRQIKWRFLSVCLFKLVWTLSESSSGQRMIIWGHYRDFIHSARNWPLLKDVRTTMAFNSHDSFYKYLPGTCSAACTRHWAVVSTDMCRELAAPRSSEKYENLLRNHPRQSRMAAIWPALAICAAWAPCRETYAQLSASEMIVRERRCGPLPWQMGRKDRYGGSQSKISSKLF